MTYLKSVWLSHSLVSQRSGGFPGLTRLVQGCLSGLSPWQPRSPQAAPLTPGEVFTGGYFEPAGSLWQPGIRGWVIFRPEIHSAGKGEGRMTFPLVIKTT